MSNLSQLLVFSEITEAATTRTKAALVVALTFINPAMMMVDNIHFQYNGFLFGILLVSLACLRKGYDLAGGVVYAVLLNFKHIYLYVAPLYFVYLLRHYCFVPCNKIQNEGAEGKQEGRMRSGSAEEMVVLSSKRAFSVKRFLLLGVCVILAFAASFGPFLMCGNTNGTKNTNDVTSNIRIKDIAGREDLLVGESAGCGIGALKQILWRLFPAKRGLCHTYWAPNVWAIYNFIDKLGRIYR